MTIRLSSEDITDLIEVIEWHLEECPGTSDIAPDVEPDAFASISEYHVRLEALRARLQGLTNG